MSRIFLLLCFAMQLNISNYISKHKENKVIVPKYNAKNLLEHTVILKINTVPTSIPKGKTTVVEFTEGKDLVLFPKGSIEFTPYGSNDEAEKAKEALEAEKAKEALEAEKAKEALEAEKAKEALEAEAKKSESEPKVTEKKETASQSKARKAKEAKASRASKAKDVKIETEDK